MLFGEMSDTEPNVLKVSPQYDTTGFEKKLGNITGEGPLV